MPRKYPALTFSDSVKAQQTKYGSRQAGAMMEAFETNDSELGVREEEFISGRDGFYMASVGENGWPYVQFRGGPAGFLKVLDPGTLGYVDYGGNRQYISTGNLRADDRVALILMDYARRRRMKIMARTRILEAGDHPEWVARLHDPDYRASVERVVLFDVEAFDWNCPQHITPRFTEAEIEGWENERHAAREAALLDRIRELESRLDAAGSE